MEGLIQFVTEHAAKAHWVIFGSLLLAGCNVPISIDVVVILSAVLAASFIPEHVYILYASVLFGCLFSAWIAYGLGRFIGQKLAKNRLFSKLLSEERLQKMQQFYEKYGIWTFVIGRFIPFGVRNCIFMTSGMSRMPFYKFILRDGVACLLWSSTAFTLFYLLGQNFQVIWGYVKTFNAVLFSAFGVTVITIIWYKLKKRKNLVTHNKTDS